MPRLWLSFLGVVIAFTWVHAVAPEPVTEEEKLLKSYKIATDDAGLLQFLRGRFQSALSEAEIEQLIEQLGDDSFEKREGASRALLKLGIRVRKQLQEALQHADLEVRYRADRILREIGQDGVSAQLLQAALRLVGKRKPQGAAELLLEQVPRLEEDSLREVVQETLMGLAIRQGKAHPALVTALTDRVPTKRRAAALALARAGARDQLPTLRTLLDDSDRELRVPLALALVRWREKAAIDKLIAELDQPIGPEFGQIEHLLFRLAGEQSPTLQDAEERARKKYRKEWEAWWKTNRDKVDLGVLEEQDKLLGRTMIVLLDENQVLDVDGDNKVRWKIDKVEMPLDVQPLPGERVLLAEYKANRVTERDSKGRILWQKRISEPLVAQRLANGHTFVANKDVILEFDRSGKEVFSYRPPGGAEIMRASKVDGGDILLVSRLGVPMFTRLDRFGNRLKSFGVEVATSGGKLDVTASGNVLIPELNNNRVVEYDGTGKQVRVFAVAQPISCVSLPSGNVLVTSMTEKRAVELDRTGKQVWEYRRDTRVTRAIRY